MKRIISIALLAAACSWSCNTRTTASGIGRPAWDLPAQVVANGVYVSEVYAPADGDGAFVELHNGSPESVDLDGYALCSPSGCQPMTMALGADDRVSFSNVAELAMRSDVGVLTLEDADGQIHDLFGWGCDPLMLAPEKSAGAFVMGAHEPGTFIALPFGFAGSASLVRDGAERGCRDRATDPGGPIDSAACPVTTLCDAGDFGLAISEVLPDLSASGAGWVEIVNTTDASLDVSMVRVCAFPSCAVLPMGTSIASGERALVGFGEEVSGGLALGASAPQASGAVAILAPGSVDYRDSVFIDFVQYGTEASGQAEVVVDQCGWPAVDALAPSPSEAGQSLSRVEDEDEPDSFASTTPTPGEM